MAASQSKTAVMFPAWPTPQHSLPAAAASPTNLFQNCSQSSNPALVCQPCSRDALNPVAISPSSQPRHRVGSVSRSPSLCSSASSSSSLKLCPAFAAIQRVLRLHVMLLLLLPPHVQALPLGGLEPSGRPRGWISFSQTPVTASQESLRVSVAAGTGRPFPFILPDPSEEPRRQRSLTNVVFLPSETWESKLVLDPRAAERHENNIHLARLPRRSW